MTWYLGYLVFALSGGIMSYYTLYRPAMYIALQHNPSCICSKSPILTAIIWMTISVVIVPLLVTPIIIRQKQAIFIITLARVFASKNGEEHNE